MDVNPYAPSSQLAETAPPQKPRNILGTVGLSLSMTALAGGLSVGSFGNTVSLVGMCVAFLALPGMVISLLALCWSPRHLAAWGLGVGFFQSLYLPTFYLSMFVLERS